MINRTIDQRNDQNEVNHLHASADRHRGDGARARLLAATARQRARGPHAPVECARNWLVNTIEKTSVANHAETTQSTGQTVVPHAWWKDTKSNEDQHMIVSDAVSDEQTDLRFAQRAAIGAGHDRRARSRLHAATATAGATQKMNATNKAFLAILPASDRTHAVR